MLYVVFPERGAGFIKGGFGLDLHYLTSLGIAVAFVRHILAANACLCICLVVLFSNLLKVRKQNLEKRTKLKR